MGMLKPRAQTTLGVGRGRLVGSSGTVLDANAPIKRARLQDGDFLTLHINRVQVQPADSAFAAVTWGAVRDSGDIGAVQDQLRNVPQIQASGGAFAAILGDGSVVTWISDRYHGDRQERFKKCAADPSRCRWRCRDLGST